jgi:hypothetical protein
MDWQTQFQHMWREGNKNADWLANHSLMHESFDFITLETSPIDLQSILCADISKASMPRTVRVIS